MNSKGQVENRRENTNKALSFEETAQKAIRQRRNLFEYLNHYYFFKTDNNGNVYICSEGRFIAHAFIKNGKCLVHIVECEKGYVSNVSSPVYLETKCTKFKNGGSMER